MSKSLLGWLTYKTQIMNRKHLQLLIGVMVAFFAIEAQAQDMLGTVKLSQKSTIIQRIGNTDITVVYHSPKVNGRKIFGGIVPFDFVVDGKEYAWRAGSNNRTTIEFTHDVTIEGQLLKAGSYGLVILVSEKEWTWVFSSNKTWGAFQYDQANDVLRVTVPTQQAPFQEWLSYDFINRESESAGLELHWERTRSVLNIKVDVTANMIAQNEAVEEKKYGEYIALAYYKRKAGLVDAAGALEIAEQALAAEANFQTKIYKADLLIELGRKKEGEALKAEALAEAEGFNMYYYGLSYLLLRDNKKEAHRLLTDYVKRKPNDWIAHLSLGEYYLKDGKQKKVVAHFKQAYENAPDNWRNYARYLYLQNKLVLEN